MEVQEDAMEVQEEAVHAKLITFVIQGQRNLIGLILNEGQHKSSPHLFVTLP